MCILESYPVIREKEIRILKNTLSKIDIAMLNVTAAICRFLFCENRLSLLYNRVGRFFSLTLSICKLFEVPLGTNQFY